MSCSRVFFACLATLSFAAGCDNNTNIGPLVPFSRPEHVAFACYAQKVGTSGDNAVWDVLPQACCTSSIEVNYSRDVCGLGVVGTDGNTQPGTATLLPAHLHALVTQSTRGEVAAVDMTLTASDRVLDSDSQIPGYTFLDSGGLPSAVVMPTKQPRASGVEKGAMYAFVASAEEYYVRAIPACRFRSGRACGPENEEDNLAPRLIVPLPGAPGDMLLGPDEALWVTLPDLGLIARVELADTAISENDAFALDVSTQLPKLPQFFRVPDADVGEPVAPISEARPYAEICGLANAYRPEEISLPIAPRAKMAPIRPKLLRYDAANRVLLVADAAAPAIHAFTLGTEGTLTSLGALPTGAPIRDLALTAPVPAEVPRAANGAPAALLPAELDALPSVRYVYAIDDRDGSVMVSSYEVVAGVPRLTPLLAPSATQRFADRIDLAQPANALDVVDTRADSNLACNAPFDPASVGPQAAGETDQAYADRVKGAPAAYETNVMVPLRDTAGTTYPRGVFVTVVAESGNIAMIDVHDLDLACRAAEDCDYPNAKPTTPLRPDIRAAVTVRRHASRRVSAGPLLSGTSNDQLFADVNAEGCLPYTPVANTAKVCAPTDPWYMLADTYAVQYRASLPGATSPSGSLLLTADAPITLAADEVLLKAPFGLDLCGRGVQPDDLVALTYPTTNVSKRTQNDPCNDVGGENDNALLTVRQAYGDKLVLRVANSSRDRLHECFPDFVNFDVRSGGFLVLGSSYFNNVIANDEGVCVVDATRPRLTSRARPGERYSNPYISFQIASGADANAAIAKSATITLTQGSAPLINTLATSSFADVEPATVRYYPGLNQIFVVDSASTGLSRYALNPFARYD